MEEQEDGCMTVLEKNGSGPLTVRPTSFKFLVLDPDDFSKLDSRGLKPLHVKKLELWCEVVREHAENMLPNTPAQHHYSVPNH